MEVRKQTKESLKMILKEQLQGVAKSSFDKHWEDMRKVIEEATQHVISTMPEHEIFLEQIVRDAKAGASYVAVKEMMNKAARDSAHQVVPIISTFIAEFQQLMVEAAEEAIAELLLQQFNAKLQQK